MKIIVIFSVTMLFTLTLAHSQVLVKSTNNKKPDSEFHYEYGYLPGADFPILKTIGKYDFSGLNLRVELFDDRNKRNLRNITCSSIRLKNKSEFAQSGSIYKVQEYFDKLLPQAGIVLDTLSENRLEIRLEAWDPRLIGFGFIRAHGLCQMKVTYKTFQKIYCIDIMDGDPHSPLGKKDVVTRRTATRLIASAAIREVIEQLMTDLKNN